MGEVYRARDARLGRDVAIKILPQHLSSSPQLKERFDREARAISSLNHPRICTLFDVGHQDGTDFLVMELLEGESLADRLRRGPLPLKEISKIGMEICEALDTAHRARIIHRDLKPGNIMLTKSGAKLMDFGLAKAALAGMAVDGATAPLLSAARTVSGGVSPLSPLTTAGEVLGTIQYMSPEQLEGKEADARSDIFALGAMLYEMTTGKRPFDGKSQISVASAILEKDPEPISAIQPLTPPALERTVRTCLEKNPDDRFQSARDVRLELKWIADGASHTPPASTAPTPSMISEILPWALAATLALALVALYLFLPAKAANIRYSTVTFREGKLGAARFSHDGNTVVYSGEWEGGAREIDTFRVGSIEARDLGIPDATVASVSSSDQLAVLRTCERIFLLDCGGTLASVDLSGGSPRELAAHVAYADWSPDGTQLMVSRISPHGTQLEFPLGHIVLQQKTGWFGRARLSPDGSMIAFENHPDLEIDDGDIEVVDLHGNRKTLSKGWLSLEGLAWGPDGKEVWFASDSQTGWADSIRAVSMSGKVRTLLTSPSIRLHDVYKDGRALVSREDWGSHIIGFFPGDKQDHPYSWLDDGEPTAITSDGRRVSFIEEGEVWSLAGAAQCFIRETNGSPPVSFGAGITYISPDGKSVVVVKQSPAKLELQSVGAGESRDLSMPGFVQYDHVSWSEDGRYIVYEALTAEHDWNIYVRPVSGGEPRMVQAGGRDGRARLSFDGSVMVFRDSVRGELLINRMDGSPSKQLSGGQAGDYVVRFTNDGKSLLVAEASSHEVVLSLMDVASGSRKEWKHLPNAIDASRVVATGDLKYYAYSTPRYSSVLDVVSGLH